MNAGTVVEIIEPEFLDWVDPQQSWDPIAGGFEFTEGPVWRADEQALYFSDIPADRIYRWDFRTERLSIVRWPSRKTNGMTDDPQGFLLGCEQATRRVVRIDRDGSTTPVVASWNGFRLNSPNDIVIDQWGNIWFTDPTFGIQSLRSGYPAHAELQVRGVYCYEPTSAQLALRIDDCDQPNGLAFSPDGSMLYVSDSARYHIRRFSIQDRGHIVKDLGVFAELDMADDNSPPDGLRTAVTGDVFATGPGGIWVFNPESALIGRLHNVETVANLTFGGVDYRDLFVTASSSVCRLSLKRSAR